MCPSPFFLRFVMLRLRSLRAFDPSIQVGTVHKNRRFMTTGREAAGALRPMYSAACFRVRSRLPLEKPAWSAIREATALAIASISSDSSFIAALLRQKPHLVHSLRLAAA